MHQWLQQANSFRWRYLSNNIEVGEEKSAVEGAGPRRKPLVRVDPSLHKLKRPSELNHLRGNASKAMQTLAWRPTRSFSSIVSEMVKADIALLRRTALANTGQDPASYHKL